MTEPQPSEIGARLLAEPAKVAFWAGPPAQAVYIGRGLSLDVHRHYATQITIGLGRPVLVRTATGDLLQQHSFVVGPNVAHGIEAAATPILEIFSEARALADFAERLRLESGSETPELPAALVTELWPHLLGATEKLAHGEVDNPLLVTLVDRVLQSTQEDTAADPRVAAARSLVTAQFLVDHDRPIDELADRVHLSTSRFRHLWRQEMGMSIQSYLRWQRLLTAMQNTVRGASLTEAAHGAGFSDSAHLTRVFRATFGIPPSRIFKDSRSVQVLTATVQ